MVIVLCTLTEYILDCMQLLTSMQVIMVAINAAKLQLCALKQNSRSRPCARLNTDVIINGMPRPRLLTGSSDACS